MFLLPYFGILRVGCLGFSGVGVIFSLSVEHVGWSDIFGLTNKGVWVASCSCRVFCWHSPFPSYR